LCGHTFAYGNKIHLRLFLTTSAS